MLLTLKKRAGESRADENDPVKSNKTLLKQPVNPSCKSPVGEG